MVVISFSFDAFQKEERERGIVSTIHRQQNKNGCDLSLNHGIVSATTVTLNMLQK